MATEQEFKLPEELQQLLEDIYGNARSGPGAVARHVAHRNPYECLLSLLATINKELKSRDTWPTLSTTVGHAMPSNLIMARYLEIEAEGQPQVEQQTKRPRASRRRA